MKILDCEYFAETNKQILKEEFKRIRGNGHDKPCLAIVNSNLSSAPNKAYINSKIRWCEQLGVDYHIVELGDNTTDDKFMNTVRQLNRDNSIHGIILQLPTSPNISEDALKLAKSILNPDKDVDGFSPENVYKTFTGDYTAISPCTPKGIIELIDFYSIDLEGKNVCIINRSELVGLPLSVMMTNRDSTVTLCHSKTKDLKSITKNSDIIITAVGKKGFITGDMVKDNTIIIDIGISREDKKLYGDIDIESIKDRDITITKTPSGSALCTLTELFNNLLECYQRQIYDDYYNK